MLAHHPQVFMASTKEPRFFTRHADNPAPGVKAPRMASGDRYSRGIDWYEGLFDGGERYPARGEASPQYIGAVDGPELMLRHVPELKVIFILRNPVVRAQSHYWFHKVRGEERKDHRSQLPPFSAALDDHPLLRYFIYFGRYRQHVERYRLAFGRDRVHVVLFDDLRQDPAATYAQVCRFIGVDDTFPAPSNREYNPTGAPLVAPLQFAIERTKNLRGTYLPRSVRGSARRLREYLERWNRRKSDYPRLEPEVFAQFVEIYGDDIAYVEELTRPLPEWRKP